MLKRILTYSLEGVLAVAIIVTVAGFTIKKLNAGRIAPGVMVCGRDLSGLTMGEAEQVIEEMVPECVTELRCRFLPEMREEVEARVREFDEKTGWRDDGTREDVVRYEESVETGESVKVDFETSEKELYLTMQIPMFRVNIEETLQAVAEKSNEAKVWEWLYEAVFGRPFRVRCAESSIKWEEWCFRECVAKLQETVEREWKDATVSWEKGQVKVTESERGFRLNTEELWEEAEAVVQEAIERVQTASVEGLVLRFYVDGTAWMPSLSTEQAENCNTVIGTFVTTYTGAGNGRAQNIEAGAEKLHGAVILPGEEFSVAEALMPFTEDNGYAAGGTYIDGQLSESIGGGVCQLSSTIYNALLQTGLEITERHPHSLPVGYVPLGQDAAIAGDYKDLKFKNTTRTPILLLCEATGEEVKVTVYGPEEAKRRDVSVESVMTEETEDSITVEVYRTETGTKGTVTREKVSEDRYRRKTGDTASERPE